jgi:GNAT superfamily N-acetyltransferase
MNQPKPPSNILIRLAVMDEAPVIASVLYQAFVEFEAQYTPAAFAATTPASDQIRKRWSEGPVWVVEDGGQLVGTVSAVPKSEGLYIGSMAVLPFHRGEGIGNILLQAVEHLANIQGIQSMFLSTTPFLTGAIRLYERFGFHRSNDGPHDLFGTPLFTMTKLLEPANQRHQNGTNILSDVKRYEQMKTKALLEDVSIRTTLQPGDIGYVIYMHGALYGREYNYGIQFETYVAKGLCEFYEQFNPKRSRVWVCEHNNRMIGFLLLIDRGESAQLRYFLIEPEYRGIGLGSKLMNLYMDFLHQCGYRKSYLWTTHELTTAASLYKRSGFQLAEEKESTSFGKPLREQRYDLVLP